MSKDRIILNINPYQQILSTQRAKKLFQIPEFCPHDCGLPRKHTNNPMVQVATMKEDFPDLWKVLGGDEWPNRRKKKEMRYGCPHMIDYQNLKYLKRLMKYNDYKKEVRRLAEEQGLVIPDYGWSLYFYIPMPVSWPLYRRAAMKGQPHDAKPDQKNFLAAFEDALRKDDERIGQMSGLGKFWIDTMYKDENGKKKNKPGYIEILLNQPVYNPFSVKFI